MRRRIFSDDSDIREQSERYCSDQKLSISRTNQAHRYSNSLHQRKSDRRIHQFSLRVIDQMIIDDLTKSLIRDKFVQFRAALKIE